MRWWRWEKGRIDKISLVPWECVIDGISLFPSPAEQSQLGPLRRGHPHILECYLSRSLPICVLTSLSKLKLRHSGNLREVIIHIDFG